MDSEKLIQNNEKFFQQRLYNIQKKVADLETSNSQSNFKLQEGDLREQ